MQGGVIGELLMGGHPSLFSLAKFILCGTPADPFTVARGKA
jgi:hypothetical protein